WNDGLAPHLEKNHWHEAAGQPEVVPELTEVAVWSQRYLGHPASQQVVSGPERGMPSPQERTEWPWIPYVVQGPCAPRRNQGIAAPMEGLEKEFGFTDFQSANWKKPPGEVAGLASKWGVDTLIRCVQVPVSTSPTQVDVILQGRLQHDFPVFPDRVVQLFPQCDRAFTPRLDSRMAASGGRLRRAAAGRLLYLKRVIHCIVALMYVELEVGIMLYGEPQSRFVDLA
ncbi:hypothetical protein HPB47_004455, partial [Ixodes persulcatus]